MEEEFMLTTFDNPFDPFTEYDKWLQFDLEKGHNCCAMVANFGTTSALLSDDENRKLINDAVETVVLNDVTNIYKRVSRKI